MIIQRNRDGSFSAFAQIDTLMMIAEGATRAEAFASLMDMIRNALTSRA